MKLIFNDSIFFWIIFFNTIEIFTTLNANPINLSRDKSNFYLEKLQEDIKFFNNYERSPPLLHNLQTKFKCCGFNGPEDYKTSIKPSACMQETINHEELKGCAEIIKNHKPVYENECERIFDDYEYHRERFFAEMKYFEEQDSESTWLENIQTKYQCCGFNGPRDYKFFFKPPSCCDRTNNDKNLLKRCQNPPKDVEGSLGSSPHYYTQGCSKHLEFIINKVTDKTNNDKDETSCDKILSKFENDRNRFFETIQTFDENGVLSPWLEEIQTQNKCCGYDGPRDYVGVNKPSSCRDYNRNNNQLVEVVNQMDNSDEATQYYSLGCGRIFNENTTKYFNMEMKLTEKRNGMNSWFWFYLAVGIFIVIFLMAVAIAAVIKICFQKLPKSVDRKITNNPQIIFVCVGNEEERLNITEPN